MKKTKIIDVDYVEKVVGEAREAVAKAIWHEESCGCCGRKLTVPSSIESGFGPICLKRMGGLS